MRSRPFWSRTGSLTTTPSVIFLPSGWRELKVSVDALSYGQVGAAYAAPAVAPVSGIVTISSLGSPTGGDFSLLVFPRDDRRWPDIEAETAAIAYNASAATIKTRLLNTNLFVSGDISAGGGALPTDVTLTFTGVYANLVPPIIAQDNNLTGGNNPRIMVRTTTNPLGNGGYGYVNANTQETWQAAADANKTDRFLYLAAVTGTATYYATAYR